MSAEQEEHRVDLHLHVADDDPHGDAPQNTAKAVLPVFQALLAAGAVSAVFMTGHDRFPGRSLKATARELRGIETLTGTEIATRLPDSKRRMVHLLGLFPERPTDWRLGVVNWPKSLKGKLATLSALPPLDEVMSAIGDSGGIPIIAHPTPQPLPWGSLSFAEIKKYMASGVIPRGTPVEINSHWLHRPVNVRVGKFASTYDLPLVGGSDAHVPGHMGRRVTVFPNRTGNVFADLKEAVRTRTTRVEGKAGRIFHRGHTH